MKQKNKMKTQVLPKNKESFFETRNIITKTVTGLGLETLKKKVE